MLKLVHNFLFEKPTFFYLKHLKKRVEYYSGLRNTVLVIYCYVTN